ncbi:hypothetical protein BS78_06G271000 [Paspalum vaginatum]|nr:hypothetical protein BS78_06G271000 [Paspalum vaginatum]
MIYSHLHLIFDLVSSVSIPAPTLVDWLGSGTVLIGSIICIIHLRQVAASTATSALDLLQPPVGEVPPHRRQAPVVPLPPPPVGVPCADNDDFGFRARALRCVSTPLAIACDAWVCACPCS